MRLVVKDDEFSRSYDIPEGESVVGRSPDCDISIPASTLSKEHVRIIRHGDQVSVSDMNTTNGTYLNGMKVATADLKHQDVITLGRVGLVFDQFGEAEQMPGAAPAMGADGPVFFDAPGQGDQMPGHGAAMPGQPGAMPGDPGMMPPLDAVHDAGPVMPDGMPFDAGPASGAPTPADGDFMPARYEPERQHGPQLVARGDRWFIRDPITNREVEIAPTGAGGTGRPNLDGYYAGRKKKKLTQIVLAASGILIALIVGLAMLPEPEVEQPKKMDSTTYSKLVNSGIDELDAGEYDKADAQFQKAIAGMPKPQVAPNLIEIGKLWREAGDDMSGLNWVEARRLLEALQTDQFRTARAESFADAKIDWMRREDQQKRILAKAQTLHSAGEVEEAYKYVAFLSDGPIKAGSRDFFEQVRDACEQKHRTDARQFSDGREWDSAIESYSNAKPYLKDPSNTRDLDDAIEDCRQFATHQAAYDGAVADRDGERYTEAIAKLEQIPDTSPYAPEARTLKKAAEAAWRLKKAEHLFDSGQGTETIKYIDTELGKDADPRLKELALATLKLQKAGIEAFDGGRLADAIDIWAKTETLLADRPGNYYADEAKQKREALEQNPANLARMFVTKASEFLNNDDPDQARKYALLAEKYDPGSSKGIIKQLLRNGRRYYNNGSAAYYRKEYSKAEKEFRNALRYLTPADKQHAQAVRLLNDTVNAMKNGT